MTVKWGNPEVVFKKDPALSANNTPLGQKEKKGSQAPSEAQRGRGGLRGGRGGRGGKTRGGLHSSAAERWDSYDPSKEEMYEDIVEEYLNNEGKWGSHGKEALHETIAKFKYLLANPNDDDDISVKSYRTEAGAPNKGQGMLTKGQKKNLAVKKKTLCDKARKLRIKRIEILEQFKDRLSLCYCPVKACNERDGIISKLDVDIRGHKAKIEGNGVVMEYD